MFKVVTVTDESGRSTLSWSGKPAGVTLTVPPVTVTELWSSDEVPPPLDGPDLTFGDESVAIEMAAGAFRCRFVTLAAPARDEEPFFHRTPTLDIVVVTAGAVSLLLDDGSVTRLDTGDTIVQRATKHAWRAEDGQSCTLLSFTVGLGAEQVVDTGQLELGA